ncbi:hypothetical protein ABIB62_001294 [Mucilaginibacter sp. UYP25]
MAQLSLKWEYFRKLQVADALIRIKLCLDHDHSIWKILTIYALPQLSLCIYTYRYFKFYK